MTDDVNSYESENNSTSLKDDKEAVKLNKIKQKKCDESEDRSNPAPVHYGDFLMSGSRFIAFIPVVGLFLSAIYLTISSLVTSVFVIFEAATGEIGAKDSLVEFVESADIFLLAIVLYIIALGIYSLFISDDIKLPKWLEFHTLDDLKEKFISVVIVALGVSFFGTVIGGSTATDIAFKGVGIACVVFTLSYYAKAVLSKK